MFDVNFDCFHCDNLNSIQVQQSTDFWFEKNKKCSMNEGKKIIRRSFVFG